MSGGIRVSTPPSVRKTVQNIKEIFIDHTDEEIYAMLKECSMDPNETVQKLMFQDTFHEVRRKRDKKKENVNTREPVDDATKTTLQQGKGGKGGRGNYSSRYSSHGGGKSVSAGKENGSIQGIKKDIASSIDVSVDLDINNNTLTPFPSGSLNVTDNGPINIEYQESACKIFNVVLEEKSSGEEKMVEMPPDDINNSGELITKPIQLIETSNSVSTSKIYSSASDPILISVLDSSIPGTTGKIKQPTESRWTAMEPNGPPEPVFSVGKNDYFQAEEVLMPGKTPSKPQGIERSNLRETSQAISSSTHVSTSNSRPSSAYGGRRAQHLGSQKALGPSKEWKPKTTSTHSTQASGSLDTSVSATVTHVSISQPTSTYLSIQEVAAKLQKKLEKLHFTEGQHVIIPSHLVVPEAERSGFSFGSFDADFQVQSPLQNDSNDKSSTPLSESSQGFEETAEEPSLSAPEPSLPLQDGDYPESTESPTPMPENLSSDEANGSSNVSGVPEYQQSKPETELVSGPQYPMVHTTSNYSSFGFGSSMIANPFPTLESTESQGQDISRISNIVVQPFDPSMSYYTQFYRPGTDGDGRFSPVLATGSLGKYNGNTTILPLQTGQPPQELQTGSSLVFSTAGTSLVPQTAGVLQSSIASAQQAVPVFRQPTGVHISHYPANYIPYNQYYPPFYVPPATIHHFLSNATFPQQPPSGNMYPPPPTAVPTVKYSPPQFKPGNNNSNSPHPGLPTGYGSYHISVTSGYSPPVTSGNSTGNEDLTQFKDSNLYINGQQSEGSAVWVPAPTRELPNIPAASSFYNIAPQGQHVTIAPQAGPSGFTGIFHPSQTMASAAVHPLLQQSQTMAGAMEMVGPSPTVFQQPQRAQINWGNNY